MSKKKQKLSDRIVAKLWGKKKKTVIADDNKVEFFNDPVAEKFSEATITAILKEKPGNKGWKEEFKPLPKQEYLGEIIVSVEEITNIYKDPITMASAIEDPDSDLMIQFKQETGKHAVWGGKKTKQFLNWKEKLKVV